MMQVVYPFEDYIEVDHDEKRIFVPRDSYWYEEEHRERLLRLYPGYRVIFDGEEPIESLDIWIEL